MRDRSGGDENLAIREPDWSVICEDKIKKVADYCETDVVGTWRSS
jgi:hypothetical protein